jgi:hypothetical protein
LPFLNWKLEIKTENVQGNEYFVRFNDFNGTVGNYKVLMLVQTIVVPIITLGMQRTNKARMVEYTTVKMLIKRQLDSKNQFATNTINFIDSTLVAMESQLRNWRRTKVFSTR